MDVREKLIDILRKPIFPHELVDPIEAVADYLLDSGITVQELDGCEYCRIASYTEKPFIVITQMGREVKTQFNFCPHCGRRLPHPPEEND